jgi:hypothetical protein
MGPPTTFRNSGSALKESTKKSRKRKITSFGTITRPHRALLSGGLQEVSDERLMTRGLEPRNLRDLSHATICKINQTISCVKKDPHQFQELKQNIARQIASVLREMFRHMLGSLEYRGRHFESLL